MVRLLRFSWIGLVVFTTGCSGSIGLVGTAEKITEEARFSNKSNTVDAVLLLDYHDEGATGGEAFYKVLVVPKGARATEKDNNLVLEVSDATGYGKDGYWRPEWRGNDRLLIRLKQARVWRFTNYVWDSGGHNVGARLLIDGYGAN